jgi:hypothetical protein
LKHRSWFEKPSPYDFEAFFSTCRPPGGLHSANNVAKPHKRLSTSFASNLGIIGQGVGRTGIVRRREADNKKAIFCQLRRFREYLGEAEMRFKTARGQITLVMKLASIGHPLID